MNEKTWTDVDDYISNRLVPSDDALQHALMASEHAGLPPHQVSPAQGFFLSLQAQAVRSRRILEIGTLGGYSTIWLARGLPVDGRLISLEVSPHHAEVARSNLAHAKLSSVAEVRCGQAVELLPKIASEGLPPFDLIFIDADKASSAEYFGWAVKLSRVGTVIITDNVVRGAALLDEESADPSVVGVRRLHEYISREPRVAATTIQTVGCKGYDGFCFAVVNKL